MAAQAYSGKKSRCPGIKHPVLAWGLGVSRVAMLRLGLKDIRELYQSDSDWLRKSTVI